MTAAPADVTGREDLLILVDEQDREIGTRPKTAGHLGSGVLHRAFSVFLFNERCEVLLQRRAAGKMLWPGYWSNSVCSHPRPGETTEAAVRRRVREELSVACELQFLYKFRYQAPYGDIGAENELCWVYAGYPRGLIATDPAEIAEWRYVAPEALTREIAEHPDRFSPWMKMEWAAITADHLDRIRTACHSPARP